MVHNLVWLIQVACVYFIRWFLKHFLVYGKLNYYFFNLILCKIIRIIKLNIQQRIYLQKNSSFEFYRNSVYRPSLRHSRYLAVLIIDTLKYSVCPIPQQEGDFQSWHPISPYQYIYDTKT